jgi:serine/threonine protein phosphatase 1
MSWFSAPGVFRSGQGNRALLGVNKPKERWLSETFSWLVPDARQNAAYPPAPEGTLIYVIGDIHGRIDLLEELWVRIDRDVPKAQSQEVLEIYLGDYIDRGPASAKVLDRLTQRPNERKRVFLRGNHEQVLEHFLSCEATLDEWCQIGGLETLVSYQIDPDLLRHPKDDDSIRMALAARIPDSHRQFLRDLRTHYSAGAYFFVHAGVRPGVPLEKQGQNDCLWIREEFLEHDDDFGRIVVHGHSPVPEPEFLPNRINLDTAAYATGRLSCLKISRQGARLLEPGPAEGTAINS